MVKLEISDAKDAEIIHFERDGAIRFADKPENNFDCQGGKYSSGTLFQSYHLTGPVNPQFVRYEDDIISPKEYLNVILETPAGCFVLQDKYIKP